MVVREEGVVAQWCNQRRRNREGTGGTCPPRFFNKQRSALFKFRTCPLLLKEKRALEVSCPPSLRCFLRPWQERFFNHISTSPKLTFSLTKIRHYKYGLVMALYRYCAGSVVYQYGAETFFMGRVTGQWVFFAMISYGASGLLCKNILFPPAMPYDKACSVHK